MIVCDGPAQKDGVNDVGARPMTDDVGGAVMHPWFVGSDGPGRVRRFAPIAVATSVPLLALIGALVDGGLTGRAVAVLGIAVVVGLALRYRARWPLAVLLVALLGVVAALLVDRASPALVFGCLIAVFTVACLRPRRVAGPAALVGGVLLFAVARTDVTGSMTEARALIVVVWTALAFALGVAVRTKRAYVSALAERVRRADEAREQEARTRVVEERLRIARELHDVVAHHIAVINVHAGLARRAVSRDAETVDTSLGYVQEAARTVLDELGTVLSMLRSADAGEPAESTTQPAPGLERLDELLETFAAAGFQVRTKATGRPREMDPACDLAAFRIIQESLTNASKHGADGQAELSLAYTAPALTIAVSNLVHRDPAEQSTETAGPPGHGLIGMRERAMACGGSMTAHQDSHGTFRVAAVVPYRPTGAPDAWSAPGTTTPEGSPRGHRDRAQPQGIA